MAAHSENENAFFDKKGVPDINVGNISNRTPKFSKGD